MQKQIVVAVLLAAAFAPASALADGPPPTRRGWEVGLQAAKYHYEEPNFAELSGNRGGLVAAFTEINPRRVFFRIDGRVSYGSLHYKGSGTQDNNPDWIYEVRAVVGRDFLHGNKISISPYLGLGYRHLYSDVRGYTSTGHVGYRRYSNYAYAPLGVTLRAKLGSQWVVAPTIEYDAFLGGNQYSQLSDTATGYSDASNTQKHGRGYRAQIMVESERWTFGPWLHYWNIKDSDIVYIGFGTGGLEPANWTREYGMEVRYRF